MQCSKLRSDTGHFPDNIRFRSDILLFDRTKCLTKESVQLICVNLMTTRAQGGTVQKNTVEKWIKENNKGIETSIWLKFETSTVDRDQVAHLHYLCALPE